jgi:hypothetical protein
MKISRTLSRTSSDVTELFNAIDKNEDGVLSRKEFEFAMRSIGLEQLRSLQQSLSRNELSRTLSRKPSAPEVLAATVEDTVPDEDRVSFAQKLIDRTIITAEVTVSKIFPAGFGWQTASLVAEGAGFQGDSAAFALTTGIGDGLGVLIGHSGYYAAKRAITGDDSINMSEQVHTGVLLGTAALCSGTAWQPIVNFLQGAGCSFNQTAAGVVAGCGAAFFCGLRGGRLLYSDVLSGVESATYSNLKADAALSVSIGGATGAFVGTDVSFAAGQNWLRPVVGIEEGMGDLAGCATAGASTAIGFTAFQSVQNAAYPQGKNWCD